jgi:hypothetical protein
VTQAISAGQSSIQALRGSTEEAQFARRTPDFAEAEAHHVLERVSSSPHLDPGQLRPSR